MRKVPNSKVERYRLTDGPMGSDTRAGNNGCFFIPCPGTRANLQVIVSDGMDWEHVSVSLRLRCPTWTEMCYVKDLFWDEEETVMQPHPPRSEWVNNHPYCLHLWRPTSEAIPRPSEILVGVKSAGTLQP